MDVSTTVITLASIPAILAVVQLLKDLGWVIGKWSALASLVLGIVFKVADYGFTTATPTPNGWYTAVIAGAILGLSASGLYEASKTAGVSMAKKLTSVSKMEIRK